MTRENERVWRDETADVLAESGVGRRKGESEGKRESERCESVERVGPNNRVEGLPEKRESEGYWES